MRRDAGQLLALEQLERFRARLVGTDGASDAEAKVPFERVRPLPRRKRPAVAAPPAPPPPTKKPAKKKPKAKPATKATSAIWDNGSSWRPRAEAGTRNPAYHGCGKCRWRPSGCEASRTRPGEGAGGAVGGRAEAWAAKLGRAKGRRSRGRP